MEKIEEFIKRIDRLETRYKGIKYVENWLVPKEILIAVRDELKAPKLKLDDLGIAISD